MVNFLFGAPTLVGIILGVIVGLGGLYIYNSFLKK